MVEKIAIRTKTISSVSSTIIRECKENEEICGLLNRLGKEKVLESIFEENEVSCDFLYKEYESFQKGVKSEYFTWIYTISPKYGVALDAHIYLYRYNPQIYYQHRDYIPWGYAESKKYLGDTWWSEDNEILSDLKELSIIETY